MSPLRCVSSFRAGIALVLAASLGLGACSILHKKKPGLAYQEKPVAPLFDAGADDLDHHRWKEAVAYFNEVEQQHPYSEWSRRSILMAAYAHFEAGDYPEAIADADRFISLYPGNSGAAYAYYLKAICDFEQINDVQRDQAATEDARAALNEVVRRYPGTEYAEDARVKLDMVADQLAGKDMEVGRFYLRNGDPIAAIDRFRTVVETYQTTSHAPEALYRLVVCYLELGLSHEALENGAVLGYNYPGSPWYVAAYKLLTSKGLKPLVKPSRAGATGPRLIPNFRHEKKKALPPPATASNAPTGPATTASLSPR
ncbi:MAG: outer membrane protein assembly factor BamD [Caulobacteraceae bacterium]